MGFGHTVRTFSFTTLPKPGPDVPIKFGLIGNQPTVNCFFFPSCIHITSSS
jgi:hypothetical protein